MSDIIQRIRDAYTENPATALKLLPELFKQYDEGRIPVLPCKVGTRIWCIYSGTNGSHPLIMADEFDYWAIPCFGKTVFLTRESADAALKKSQL